MNISTDIKKINELLDRGTIVDILPTKKEFKERLLSGEKLRFYIGFDATAPTLHLSHAKNLMLLEKFRNLGHEVIVLFGDFTAMIGDPTDRDSKRKQLSKEDVLNNFKVWKKLIKPLMDFETKENPAQIKFNSTWLSKFSFEEVLELASSLTVNQLLERNMFKKRMSNQKAIYLHEFLYPMLQGYDSVAMDVDVELCGTDQTFNALVGRSFQKKFNSKEKFVVAVTLMEDPKTGQLMSKSNGTGVFLHESPEIMFGQIMAQTDEMIPILFINNTYLEKKEINNIIKETGPRNSKLRVSYEIVKIFHGEQVAKQAQESWVNQFSNKQIPTNIPEIILLENIIETLAMGTGDSKTQIRRSLKEGAVKRNDLKLDETSVLVSGDIVQIGKKRWFFIK